MRIASSCRPARASVRPSSACARGGLRDAGFAPLLLLREPRREETRDSDHPGAAIVLPRTGADRRALKLLVITEYFPTGEHEGITGGVESRAIALLKELAKTHAVTVICSWQGSVQPRRDTIAGCRSAAAVPEVVRTTTGERLVWMLFLI